MKTLIRKARSALIRLKAFLWSQRFGFDPAKIYGGSFYETGGFDKTERSAEVISKWILAALAPRSLLDVGCGAGHYLRAFAQCGVEVFGLEASPKGVAAAGESVLAITYDLKRSLRMSRRFDVAICVEVAEHIPSKFSRTLVESLCENASRFVVFTAAPPGTPGLDHINCQPEGFWTALFAERGFDLRDDLTRDLRGAASAGSTADWWKQWSWVYERREASPETTACAE